jgi:hypothetical protein
VRRIDTLRTVGTVARTLLHLHPVQVTARGPHALVARIVRSVPTAAPPSLVRDWPRAPEALRSYVRAEQSRGIERIARLPAPSRLRDYEQAYGLELGDDDTPEPPAWTSRTAIEPYPASVRARRIAVATRLGRSGLQGELARAARAVLLNPELHLLGNHLLENGFGLACAGAASLGPEATLWWQAGTAILRSQLPSQFLADGGHIERSASYQVALTAALLELIDLARASGRGVPGFWAETASRALGWARAVCAPDGTYPLFNDASLDAAPTIRDLSALAEAVGVAPANVARSIPITSGARLTRLEPTGWVRIDAPDGSCLILDAGPDADGWQPGHAHADGLTFELWVGGERAIVDFGVASYGTDGARAETRATRSHNTVELDGLDSCEVWGAFRVGRRGRGSIVRAAGGDGGATVEVEHDGYTWLRGRPRHTRTLELRSGLLEIHDRVREGSRQRFVSRLRVDAEAASRLRIGPGAPSLARGLWYPRHGQSRTAYVHALEACAGDERGVSWRIEW